MDDSRFGEKTLGALVVTIARRGFARSLPHERPKILYSFPVLRAPHVNEFSEDVNLTYR
jgi:hypothetical protein